MQSERFDPPASNPEQLGAALTNQHAVSAAGDADIARAQVRFLQILLDRLVQDLLRPPKSPES